MLIEEINNTGPVEAFTRLRRMGGAFMLAWEDGYTYVSAGPVLTVRTTQAKTTLEAPGARPREFADPFAAVSAALGSSRGADISPFPFSSGFAGYFGYGLGRLIEPLKGARREIGGALPVPECVAGLYDPVFVHSRRESRSWLCSRSGDRERLDVFASALSGAGTQTARAVAPSGGFKLNVTKQEYLSAVESAKEYIEAGDIYQINLSQRMEIPYGADPFPLYLNLLKARRAPFCSFFDFGSFQVVSNSPERLLKVEGGVAQTCPIKGTRPRGRDADEDERLVSELKGSAKERAEHVMIVDLERNDLGRICRPGSVEVTSFETIQTYATLHHMVSTVSGRLLPGVDAPSALKAIFPGGSITGAPKIRAMEVIEELEAVPRGVYTGSIGWIDLDGKMDMSLAIRTAVCVDGAVYLNVGGGIVADSKPEEEYEETLLKARDFLDVMGL